MKPRHIAFAGGGTGGHLFPGLAVAAAVRRLAPDTRITFFTTSRALDTQLLGPTGYTQVPQAVRPFTLHPLRIPGFLRAWYGSIAAARQRLQAEGISAVLGLGGYAAGPPVVAGVKLGRRTAILNPDALPGRANRHLARKVDLAILQWDVSRQHLPAGANCATWGCPIRAEFSAADAAEGRKLFDLPPSVPVLLVTGASQGARSINQAIVRLWPEFVREHPEWHILHLTGKTDAAEVRAAYEQAGVPAQVLSFTTDMPLALAAADLVIARAGASTLAELTALGKPAILLPYPYHRDRHQHANAQVLVEVGAAVLLEDQKDATLNQPGLKAALATAATPEVRTRMAAAARTLGRADAAERVARWLLEQPA